MKAVCVLLAALAVFSVVLADNCPANTCESGQTCCELADGQYGCCPYPEATCCSDHASCCPHGYTCDVQHGQCTQKSEDVQAKEEVQLDAPRDVSCADGSSCQDGTTCCQLQSGSYGCCPYPQATCCSDKASCCPNGYTCDLQHSQCVQSARADYGKALGLAAVEARNVNCPDGSECQDGTTCCQLQSGAYGCCPYAQATCCSDKASCCPNGYTCDLQHSQCVQKGKRSLDLVDL